MTFDTIVRIRIEAPSADAAFRLERRLSHLRPSAIGRGPRWVVELDDTDDRVEEIVAAVRHWLRDVGARSTIVHVDGAAQTVAVRDAGDPLGAGYDAGGVLEHEP